MCATILVSTDLLYPPVNLNKSPDSTCQLLKTCATMYMDVNISYTAGKYQDAIRYCQRIHVHSSNGCNEFARGSGGFYRSLISATKPSSRLLRDIWCFYSPLLHPSAKDILYIFYTTSEFGVEEEGRSVGRTALRYRWFPSRGMYRTPAGHLKKGAWRNYRAGYSCPAALVATLCKPRSFINIQLLRYGGPNDELDCCTLGRLPVC